MLACTNPAATRDMIETLCYRVDVNQQVAPKTRKWTIPGQVSESAVKSGLATSQFALEMAHDRQATALHKTAQSGHTDAVLNLLSAGAYPSLKIRNAMGCTPLEVAKAFGPFPETESALLHAAVGKVFDSRYVICDGRRS